MTNKSVNFNELIGCKASLYKSTLSHCFQLGQVLFEVTENEEDGYRSSMQEVLILNNDEPKKEFLGEIVIKDHEYGHQLVDTSDNHTWLIFGTDYSESYYPHFVFRWQPKPSIEEQLKKLIR